MTDFLLHETDVSMEHLPVGCFRLIDFPWLFLGLLGFGSWLGCQVVELCRLRGDLRGFFPFRVAAAELHLRPNLVLDKVKDVFRILQL